MEPTQTLAHSKRKFNYQSLKLMTKKEVIDTIGLLYNDIQADVWMYRIS